MADRSEAWSSKSYYFSFKIQEAKIFKNAISALTEPEFNPNNKAMIEVSPTGTGCVITVQRTVEPNLNLDPQCNDQTVYGILRLKATGLVDFECINPLRKTVDLYPLSESLAHVADNDVISVYHLYETPHKLYLGFGSVPNNNPIELTLHDENLGALKSPNISWENRTVTASKDMEAMVERILNLAPEHRPYNVIVNKVAKACLGAGTFEAEAMTVDRHFSFLWRYWGLLRKALSSAEKCGIFLVTVPDKNVSSVMVEFNFGHIGDLRLLQGQVVLYGD